jgi:branched-chain amino acid transport system substrate-binding protein
VRIPLANPDFVPFMQRVKDAKPDVLFAFMPAGRQATQMMKAYGDLGLDKAGIKFIGPGDITTDEELPNMGDVAIGVITTHHYSAAATRPANKAFIAAWKKEYGEKSTPSFMSVGAWDAMDALFYVIREQKGKIDPDKTMELVKKYKNANSPRGPTRKRGTSCRTSTSAKCARSAASSPTSRSTRSGWSRIPGRNTRRSSPGRL